MISAPVRVVEVGVSVVLAEGKHPVPSRTRKLSPPAPMVLHGRLCGRVGHRRTQRKRREGPTGNGGAFLIFRGTEFRARRERSRETRPTAPPGAGAGRGARGGGAPGPARGPGPRGPRRPVGRHPPGPRPPSRRGGGSRWPPQAPAAA